MHVGFKARDACCVLTTRLISMGSTTNVRDRHDAIKFGRTQCLDSASSRVAVVGTTDTVIGTA